MPVITSFGMTVLSWIHFFVIIINRISHSLIFFMSFRILISSYGPIDFCKFCLMFMYMLRNERKTNFGHIGNWTRDLRHTVQMLYRLSYVAQSIYYLGYSLLELSVLHGCATQQNRMLRKLYGANYPHSIPDVAKINFSLLLYYIIFTSMGIRLHTTFLTFWIYLLSCAFMQHREKSIGPIGSIRGSIPAGPHNSVGRASARYVGGLGFNSRCGQN